MFESDAPVTAKDMGYAAIVACVVSGTALLVLCVYRTVRNCREEEGVLRAALIDDAV